MLSSIRNRMFTSRNLKKCALVCTTRVQYRFCHFAIFFRSCAAIVLVSTGTHLMYISLALRQRENAVINKEQTQTKYSDVINFHSIIAGYCCLLDPPLYCPGLYRPVLCFSPLDDEEQMEYISRYFCVRPLNNFGDELG